LDVLEVTAVGDPIGTDHDEQHVGVALGDPLGGLHKDVKAAHRLEAAGDVGDDLDAVGDRLARDDSLRVLDPRPDGAIDSVEDDFDLVEIFGGEQTSLPYGWAVAAVAVVEVEQDHGVAAVGPQKVDLAGQELGTEIEVGTVGVVKIFKIVENRAIEQLSQEEGRAEAGMAHDEVGFEAGELAAGGVDPVGVGHRVFKGSHTIMGCFGGSADWGVLVALDAVHQARRFVGEERTPKPVPFDQISGDVAELGRVVLMNEKDVHRRSRGTVTGESKAIGVEWSERDARDGTIPWRRDIHSKRVYPMIAHLPGVLAARLDFADDWPWLGLADAVEVRDQPKLVVPLKCATQQVGSNVGVESNRATGDWQGDGADAGTGGEGEELA